MHARAGRLLRLRFSAARNSGREQKRYGRDNDKGFSHSCVPSNQGQNATQMKKTKCKKLFRTPHACQARTECAKIPLPMVGLWMSERDRWLQNIWNPEEDTRERGRRFAQ